MNILLLGPDARNSRIKAFLHGKRHTVISTIDEIYVDELQTQSIEFIISSGYAPIIKEPVISAYKDRIINLHISYLPYGKGMHPNFWSLIEGTPKGVSIHYIDAGIDSGNIICQREVKFSDNDTLGSSHGKLMAMLEQTFFDNWDAIAAGSIQPINQYRLDTEVRYHSRIESERLLDLLPKRWDTSTAEVEEMGAELALSGQFWRECDMEIRQIKSANNPVELVNNE